MASQSLTTASQAFLHQFSHYIHIDLSCQQFHITDDPHEFLHAVQACIPDLCQAITSDLLPINSTLTHLISHPSLFITCRADALISRDAHQDRGTLLVGVFQPSISDLHAITDVLRLWVTRVRTSSFFTDYIPAPLLDASVVTRKDLGRLVVDEWMVPETLTTLRPISYDVRVTRADGEQCLEDDYEHEDIAAQLFWRRKPPRAVPTEAPAQRRVKGPTTTAASERSNLNNESSESARFRPAHEILNRLKWDPSLESQDFIVIYEDRHNGLLERLLDEWTNESTEEAFIPLHRVRSIKQADNGRVLWHREARIDETSSGGMGSLCSFPSS